MQQQTYAQQLAQGQGRAFTGADMSRIVPNAYAPTSTGSAKAAAAATPASASVPSGGGSKADTVATAALIASAPLDDVQRQLTDLEGDSLHGIKFDSTPNPALVGSWNLKYSGYSNQDFKLQLQPDGVFVQVGAYTGRWRAAGYLIVLSFDSLTLPNRPGPIQLQAEINLACTDFRGALSHPSYQPGGQCIYHAQKNPQ